MTQSGLRPNGASAEGNRFREALIHNMTSLLPLRCESSPAINPAVGDRSVISLHRSSCTAPTGKDCQGKELVPVPGQLPEAGLKPSSRIICARRSLILSAVDTCICSVFCAAGFKGSRLLIYLANQLLIFLTQFLRISGIMLIMAP